MDQGCFGAQCAALQSQTFDQANACSVPTTVDESVDGCKLLSYILGAEYN